MLVDWQSMTVAARHRPTGRLRFSDGSKSSLRGTARELGARVLTTAYRRMLFMSYSLAGIRIPVYNAGVDVSFSVLEPKNVDAYLSFRPASHRRDIEKRMVHGDRCFVSWHDGAIVDACWTATGTVYVPYLRRYLQIPEGDVYSYDSFTVPSHRGRGIYMARNSFTARAHQAEGLKRSIALVAFENYAAWLILSRSGLRTLGAYHYLRTPVKGIYWETTEPGHVLAEMTSGRARNAAMATAIGVASET